MVNPNGSSDVRGLLQPTLFGRLGPEILDEISASARLEKFQIPTLLNAAGQKLEWLRLVVEGSIEIVARRASGKEVAITDISPGGWATWLPCFLPAPPEHDFYCSANSVFVALPTSAVKELCKAHPDIYPLIMAEIGLRMRLLLEWTGQSVLSEPEQRMAKLIHILARDQKVKGNSGLLNVQQVRLAGLARCSRQTANGLLHMLEKRKLIRLAYGKIEILDMAQLSLFADHDEEI
jgi:CRP-like cAMP-binding protein